MDLLEESIDEICDMLSKKFTYSQISATLLRKYGPQTRGLSGMNVRRFCCKNGIVRKGMVSNSDLDTAVSEAVQETGPAFGRKFMTGYLASKDILAGEGRVGSSLRKVHPAYQRERQVGARNLNPIPYFAEYFGHKLHMDQNEKLVMFGVTHVLAIDGYSSFITAFSSMPIKNNLTIYNEVLRRSVLENGIWDQVRIDFGKEFYLSLFMQEINATQRFCPRRQPYIQSQSKQNHPVERIWSEVNNKFNYPLKTGLVELMDRDMLLLEDNITKYCTSNLCLTMSNIGIPRIVSAWNSHRIPDHTKCSVDKGGCHHICQPLTYYPYSSCHCYKGFHLQMDGKTCINENDTVHILFYTNNADIIQFSPQGDFENRRQLLIEGFATYEGGGIDFDPIHSKLFWLQRIENSYLIKGSFINGTDSRTEFSSSLELRSITLDVIGKKIFVSVISNSSIETVTIEDTFHKSVHSLKGGCFASFILFDAFNGFIYYGQQCSDRIYTDIMRVLIGNDYVEVIIKDVTGMKNVHPFSVDHVSGIIYWASGAYQTRIEYKAVLGMESGVLVEEGQMIQYTHTLILGDKMYVSGNMGSFGKIDLITRRGSLYPINYYFITSIKGASFTNMQGTSVTNACSEIAKCLGSNLRWICLSPEQICDGITHCYNNFDEMHCGFKNYKTNEIELTCVPLSRNHSYSYDNETSRFVNWETHLFADFININNLISMKCDVFYSVSSSKSQDYRSFRFYSFQIFHRFRQIIKSNVLRDTKYLQVLTLVGEGISRQWNGKVLNNFKYKSLLHLSLIHIDMSTLVSDFFLTLSDLITLQIKVSKLQYLEQGSFNGIMNCENLTLSYTQVQIFPPQVFQNLSKLLHLDISYNRLNLLGEGVFYDLHSLRSIDFRGNDFYFTDRMFLKNTNLQFIYSSIFSVCCVKPPHMSDENCVGPPVYISSCEDLVESRILRVFMWIFGVAAFLGNICVLLHKIKSEEGLFEDTFSVLVSNLTLSDSLMGLYLMSIAGVDQYFRGAYIWNEYKWRKSKFCSVLGILSVLSTETSVFIISLITLARYLAVKYPFKEHRMSRKNAMLGCLVAWCITMAMAVVPYYIFDGYYSSSGVCISLPLTKGMTSGWMYSFSLFIVFNFITFLFIALAQGLIVYTVKKISSKVQSTRHKKKHIEVAKRLTPIIVTDCMCWIPIGTMGILSIAGYDMPKTIYSWTIVFVLPINSALNPFLYTFNDTIVKLMKDAVPKVKRFYSKHRIYVAVFVLFGISCTIVTMLILELLRLNEVISDLQEVNQIKADLAYHKRFNLELEDIINETISHNITHDK